MNAPAFHPRRIMLLPSAGCPAACRYCFGPHDGDIMPLSVLDASAVFIEGLWQHSAPGDITFHGGEPLMAGHEWFAYALDRLTRTLHHSVRFGIQSNLWLLNQRFVDLFAKYRVAVCTSLDGSRDICDAQRGKGYFDKTMAGVRLLRENGIPVSVTGTVLPENLDRIPEIIRFFEEEQFPFSLRGATPLMEHGYAKRDCYLSAAENERLHDSVFEYLTSHPAPARVRDVEAAVQCVFEQKSTLCLYANCLGTHAAIDPHGDVYSCQRFCGHKEFALGTVHSSTRELSGSAAYQRIASRYTAVRQACEPCTHAKYCNGGCVYQMFVADKRGQPLPFCNDQEPSGRFYRKLFDGISLKLAAEEADAMLGLDTPAPYLAMACEKVHPGDVARNKRQFLQAYAWGKTGAPRYAFAYRARAARLFLNITNNCPLRCSHCSVEASSGHEDMTLETVLSVIRDAQALGIQELSLNDGEPFLYRHFRELIAEMKKLKTPRMAFKLFTSLFLDFDEALAMEALQVFREISVSLDGGEAEHNMRRGPGSFQRTCANIRQLVALNHNANNPCRILIRATLTQAQIERGVNEQAYEVGQRLGVDAVKISKVLPLGRAKTLVGDERLPVPKDEPATFFDGKSSPRNSCGLGMNLHITPEGEIYPCWALVGTDRTLGHIRDGLQKVVYGYLWGEENLQYCIDCVGKCKECSVRYLCGGICEAYKDEDCEPRKEFFLSMAAAAEQQ